MCETGLENERLKDECEPGVEDERSKGERAQQVRKKKGER